MFFPYKSYTYKQCSADTHNSTKQNIIAQNYPPLLVETQYTLTTHFSTDVHY